MNNYFERLGISINQKLENDVIIRFGIEYANKQLQIETTKFKQFYPFFDKHLINGEGLGLKTGIDIEENSWEYFQNVDFNKLANEYFSWCAQEEKLGERNAYLIGFVIGFEKSRYYRRRLKLHEDKLSFQNKITLFKHLVDKHAYGRFDVISKIFLNHINNWQNEKINKEVFENVKSLLKGERIQRAVDYLYDFYFENYCLEKMIEVDSMRIQLHELRFKKRDGKINSENYLKEKTKIQKGLTEWIKRQKKCTNC